MHAASLNATEGAMASVAAAARAARTDAMEMEAEAAAQKVEALKRTAAASLELATAREHGKRGTAANVSTTAAGLKPRQAEWEYVVREQKERRVKMLVREKSPATAARSIVTGGNTISSNSGLIVYLTYCTGSSQSHTRAPVSMARAQIIRACADREKHLLFRGWTRMCLHAASLTDAEGASAAATASARAIRAEAMAKEATIAAKKVESSSHPTAAVEAHGSQEAADFFTLRPERTYGKERQDRRAKMLVRNCYPHPDLCVIIIQTAGMVRN